MKIALALDLSPASAAVVEAAAARPWPPNSYFEVISVVEPSHLWTTSEVVLREKQRAQELVARAIKRLGCAQKDAAGSVFSGDPKNVILERLHVLGANLLMIGSHGYSTASRLLFGSATPVLLRQSPCSVEIVREAAAKNADGMKILLATDGSSSAERAAASIGQRPWPAGTEVRVLSVVELILPSARALFEVPLIDSAFLERARGEAMQRAQHAITRAREILAPSGLKVDESISVLAEIPKVLILKEARDWGADLIVTGSHGRSGVNRFLVGSVSEAVAMHADCSVEVIR